MKWQLASALATLASVGVSSPIQSQARADILDVYALRISTNSDKSLDGKYLNSNNGTVGVFQGPSLTSVQVYSVPNNNTGSIELHTYPIGVADHALALSGDGLQRDLLDVLSPGSSESTSGTYDWTSFTLTSEPQGESNQTSLLDYKQKGRWVALPEGSEGAWSVKWQSADGVFPEIYMPIQIVYERVQLKDIVG